MIFLIILPFFVICCLLRLNNTVFQKDNSWIEFFLVFLPLFFLGLYLIGLRSFDAGGDTQTYLAAFESMRSFKTAHVDAFYGRELFFWPFQYILKTFTEKRSWLILNYLICFGLSWFAYCKYTKDLNINPWIFSLILCTYYLVYLANAMRQVYAIPLIFLSMYYFIKNKNKKAFLFLFASTVFHLPSIIFTFFYFFNKLKFTLFRYFAFPLILLSISIVIPYFLQPLIGVFEGSWLSEKLELYFFGGRVSHITSIFHTLNFWLCLSLYVLSSALKNKNDILKILMFIFCLVVGLSLSPDVSERYMVTFIFIQPLIAYLILNSFRLKRYLMNLIFLFSFLSMGFLILNNKSALLVLGWV